MAEYRDDPVRYAAEVLSTPRLSDVSAWHQRFIDGVLYGVGPAAMRLPADRALAYGRVVEAQRAARRSQAEVFGLQAFRAWAAWARSRFLADLFGGVCRRALAVGCV